MQEILTTVFGPSIVPLESCPKWHTETVWGHTWESKKVTALGCAFLFLPLVLVVSGCSCTGVCSKDKLRADHGWAKGSAIQVERRLLLEAKSGNMPFSTQRSRIRGDAARTPRVFKRCLRTPLPNGHFSTLRVWCKS